MSSPASSARTAASVRSRAKCWDGVGVRDDETVEAELVPQHVGEQPAVARGGHAVEVHVGAHDVAGSRVDASLERGEVDVPQLGVGDVGVVVVTPADRRPVPGIVLGAGQHALGAEVALEAAHLGGAHGSAQEGVLARALDDPAPPGIAGDVDHGGEGPVDAHGPRLPRGDGLALLDHLRVPRGRERDRGGQDRAQPVDHVEPEDQRDPQPAALDRELLEAVGDRGVPHEQQRPGTTVPQRRLDSLRLLHEAAELGRQGAHVDTLRELAEAAEVEVLGELEAAHA